MITKSVCTLFTKSELIKIMNQDYSQIKYWSILTNNKLNDYNILKDSDQLDRILDYYLKYNRIVAFISFSYEINDSKITNFVLNEIKPYSLIDIKKRIMLI
mgnify:CR=1 FL=1